MPPERFAPFLPREPFALQNAVISFFSAALHSFLSNKKNCAKLIC